MDSLLKQARLPWVKTLMQFEFPFQIPAKVVVRENAGMAFVDSCECRETKLCVKAADDGVC